MLKKSNKEENNKLKMLSVTVRRNKRNQFLTFEKREKNAEKMNDNKERIHCTEQYVRLSQFVKMVIVLHARPKRIKKKHENKFEKQKNEKKMLKQQIMEPICFDVTMMSIYTVFFFLSFCFYQQFYYITITAITATV